MFSRTIIGPPILGRRFSSPSRQGFSLIELVMLMSIIAVLAAIAGPRYANSLALYRAQAAAQRVAADLNLARTQAKVSSAGQSVIFNLAGGSYSLPGYSGLPGQSNPYTVNLANEPYAAKFVTVSFSSTAISFDQFGQPNFGGSIVVQSGTATKTIVLDPVTGSATVQ